MVNISKLSKYKNILSIYGFLIILLFAFIDRSNIEGSLDAIQSIFVVLLPLGLSDLFWNHKNYNVMIPDEGNFFQKSNFSYTAFTWVGFLIILIFDLGMSFGLYQHFVH